MFVTLVMVVLLAFVGVASAQGTEQQNPDRAHT